MMFHQVLIELGYATLKQRDFESGLCYFMCFPAAESIIYVRIKERIQQRKARYRTLIQ